MKLYYSPISSYSMKTRTAFAEKAVEPELVLVDLGNAEARAAYRKKYPLGKVPLLELDDGYLIPESSTIIEYLDTHFDSGTRLIPTDKDDARRARFFDRQFDLYFSTPMLKIFFDGRRPEGERDARGVADAKATLDIVYRYMDEHMAKRTWVMGDAFTMADCAAAPALAYLRMVYPYADHKNLVAYAGRLAERPSFAKVWADAVPFFAKLG